MTRSALLKFIKTRWFLLIVLVVFVCCKIPHLFYPFYCDEGWVYAPAVKTMALNGPSILPGAILTDYSRGHPLLFHFLCGLWIKCFGSSNVAVHSFPLLISVIFLIVLYECCRTMFGSTAARLALLLITVQVIFFVQASFVELEVMVSLLAFLSLYCYANDRLLLTTIMLTLLFYTKESGLVFGAVIGAHALLSLFTGRDLPKRRFLRLLSVFLPVVFIGVFFMLQKARLGWYLLPYHRSLIHTNWDAMYKLFLACVSMTFDRNSADKFFLLFIVLLSLIPALKQKDIRYLFLSLPATIVYILTNRNITDHTGDVVWIVLFIVFFAVPLFCLFVVDNTLSMQARRFLLLLGCCFVAYLFFSSLSVITYRYLLVDIILLYVFLAVCINTFIEGSNRTVFYISLVGILLIGGYGFYSNHQVDDTDLEAFHAMKVQKAVVAYLEGKQAYDQEISCGCFWEVDHFVDTTEGFLSSGRTFRRMNWDTAGPNTIYAVFDNVCISNTYSHILQNRDYHLVYKTQDGNTWAEIYKRN